ncbi:MAG TPA: hypothetical protein VMU06_01500 [Stellaceae bacterium]|nr:hypothetical protein [Stellaceae bacterium]
MRSLLQHHEFGRLRRWAVVFVEFSFVQGLAQLIGFVTGVVIVRLLTVQDYAIYTIANSMLGALIVLADSGVASAAVGIGGRVWQDPIRLGQVLDAARATMRAVGASILIPAALAFVLLLSRHGASAGEAATLTVLLVAGSGLAVFNSVDLVAARLSGATRFIQLLSLAGSALRLALTAVAAAFGLRVGTAIVAIVVASGAQYWATARWLRGKVSRNPPGDRSAAAELKSVAIRQFPNSLNYVFQAQISIWLLSIFGSSGGVADLGAVTRIGAIFAVLMATMQNVIVPRYARCQDPRRVGRLCFQILAGFAVLVLAPVALVAMAPQPVLWILGPQYAHLPAELVLAVLSTSIGSLVGLAWMLNANRAWFPPSHIWIPLELSAQIVMVLLIGVSTVGQVLWVAICSGLIMLAANVSISVVFIRRFQRDPKALT